jgi:ribosomal protein S18 acetylase RimI-like enzyme
MNKRSSSREKLILFESYIDDPIIQKNKTILNYFLNEECFSNDTDYDNFSDFSNKIQYILIKPAKYKTKLTISINNKHYHVLSMMKVDYDNNKATIWNVCTSIANRGKKYFTKMFNMFLKNVDDIDELYLYVKQDAPKTISLYNHLGFRIIGEKDDKFYMKLILSKNF